MNPNPSEFLGQGLIITVVGLGLVFLALALLWGLIALLGRAFGQGSKSGDDAGEAPGGAEIMVTSAIGGGTRTVERARVAAIMAGALMANALPLHMEAPIGPAFEHGRTAPIWVMANRARSLHAWQPPRATEAQPASGE